MLTSTELLEFQTLIWIRYMCHFCIVSREHNLTFSSPAPFSISTCHIFRIFFIVFVLLLFKTQRGFFAHHYRVSFSIKTCFCYLCLLLFWHFEFTIVLRAREATLVVVVDTCPHGVWRCLVCCHHSIFGDSWADLPQSDRRGNKTAIVYVSWNSPAIHPLRLWLLPSCHHCHWKLHPAVIFSTDEVGVTRLVFFFFFLSFLLF